MDFHLDKTVYSGRPEHLENRLPVEVRTYELLDSLQIPYTRVDHDSTAPLMPVKKWKSFWESISAKIFFYATLRKQNFIFF